MSNTQDYEWSKLIVPQRKASINAQKRIQGHMDVDVTTSKRSSSIASVVTADDSTTAVDWSKLIVPQRRASIPKAQLASSATSDTPPNKHTKPSSSLLCQYIYREASVLNDESPYVFNKNTMFEQLRNRCSDLDRNNRHRRTD